MELVRWSLFTLFLIAFQCVDSVSCDINLVDGAPHVKLIHSSLSLRGTILKSRNGRDYYAFRGVRYANPPKRFEIPQPLDSGYLSDTTNDATNFGSACSRWSNFYGKFLGDEDCLFLNVFVPKANSKSAAAGLPVMLYIHGGSFSDGESDSMGAEYFMDEYVILITINYRLGALGFLSTGDSVVPGNMGLHDQAMAIKWTHHNVESFGGDRSRITIVGESAGAASIGLQLLNPFNHGLISGAISQSGTVHCPWAILDRKIARKNLYELSKLLNCGSERHSTEYVVKCLRKTSAEDIVMNQRKIAKWFPGTGVAFGPVIEPEVQGYQGFLSRRPEYLMENGQFINVPYMIGVNKDEGHFIYSTIIINNKTLTDELNRDWNRIAPDHIYVNLKDKLNNDEVAAQIRQFYFGDKEISPDSRQQLVDLHSDVFFTYGSAKTAKVVAGSNGKAFTYVFTFYGGFSLMSWHGLPDMKVVTHADELQYLFRSTKYGPELDFPKGSPPEKVSRNLVKLWTSFAADGSPFSTYGTEKQWPPASKSGSLKWYQLDEDTTLLNSLHEDRMMFWDQLRVKYYVDFSTVERDKHKLKAEL